MVDIPLNYIGFLQPTFGNGVKIGYVYVGAAAIRRGHIKILDRLRFSPPPRDPGPTAPQAKKKCNFSAAKCIF
jgi:hypothetical protein